MMAKNDGDLQDDVTLVELLKTCAKKKDLCKGTRIHADILEKGLLGRNPYISCSLISMYAKCCALEKAALVLQDLPVRDVASWSALISGYAQDGQGQEAINCFTQMQREGISPNQVTLLSVLKACGSIGAIGEGRKIHDMIINRGLLNDNVMLGTALVDMYAKCGLLTKAREMHQILPVRNVVSWSALITGYTQADQSHEALICFEEMIMEGHSPDWITFFSVLRACGSIGAIDKGICIHEEILRTGLLQNNIVLGNALVDMYCKCGLLVKAQKVLEELSVRNVITWSTLIAGYAQQGQAQEALSCFERMQREGILPNDVTFICTLQACGTIGAMEKGQEIHDEIINKGLLHDNVTLANALLDMYTKCGALAKAEELFAMLLVRDVISCNILIAGYAQFEEGYKALNIFAHMQREGLSPTDITFSCILKACGSLESIVKGKQIHSRILQMHVIDNNMLVGNMLVDMYVKCGFLDEAQQVLDKLSIRNVATWNSLIAGYVLCDQGEKALDCLAQMQREGLVPNGITYTSILKAYGSTGAVDKGKQIHDEIVAKDLLKKNIVLGTALIDMYAKCGDVAQAQNVFDDLHIRDVVAWSALIAGYAQAGQGHEALSCFVRMKEERLSPNEVTYGCILKACGNLGALGYGNRIHDEITSEKLLNKSLFLGIALVDMYVKCGDLAKAKQVHDMLAFRNTVSWSALMAGYVQQGHFSDAFNCIKQMESEGHPLNEITLLCLLSACTHAGKLDEAQTCYASMIKHNEMRPMPEHYTCMVGVFGLVGNFDNALAMINAMPYCVGSSIWLALLAACKRWGNVKLGRVAYNQMIQLFSKVPC